MANQRTITAELERKIARSRRNMFFERLWPRVWIAIGAVLAFLALSVFEVWALLPVMLHQLLLGALALTAIGGLVFALRTPYPARMDAVRHLETTSAIKHRPATTAEDTLPDADADPKTRALWEAHQARMAAEVERLKVPAAKPRTDRHDPMALRAAAILLVVIGAGFAGHTLKDRVFAAFDFGQQATKVANTRLDAWITPPTYTARPAIILADGGRSNGTASRLEAPGLTEAGLSAPEGSIVTIRTSGSDAGTLSIQLLDANGAVIADSIEEEKKAAEAAAAERAAKAAAAADGSAKTSDAATKPSEDRNEAQREIQTAKLDLGSATAKIVARLGGSEARVWDVTIIPDEPPVITQTKPHETTRRGGMKIFYAIKDDFGVASAEARFVALPPDEEDPRTQWARPDALTGPRLPLARPPKITLRLPARRSKDGKTWTFADIGSHPWAGMRVQMTLIAKDHAGNVGRSEAFDIRLAERQFVNPLARAVVEQRRNLVIDDRYRGLVRKALAALTLEPAGFIKDLGVYTGLRTAYHRLERDKTRAGLNTTIEQLWHLALRIEDGRGLSAAERRLRELQRQLSKAIQNGASDEEIKRLMQELRQAMAEFMRQLAQQGQQQQQQQQGQNQRQQFLSQQDLNRMLRELENMARQGSRDQAQEMLSQLQDLIDRMQSGRMAQRGQQGEQSRQMQEMMNQYGEIIGRQQRLMDDTHNQQRQGQNGEQGQQGQQGQGQQGQGQQGQGQQFGQNGQRGQGQRGQRGQGQQGQGQQGQGQQGQGQQGQRGQAQGGQGQRGRGMGRGQGPLSDRQAGLGQMLDGLQQKMDNLGVQQPGQLGGARDSMESARRALEQGDLGQAARDQARALEQLRQGAQQMARQMRQMMPSQYGRAGDAPLDPLGRPQRTEGPDNGSSVKVPSEIETQRAREILEELRRRLGQPQRPEVELEYIERLLERF